jgi:hypothetical protein
VSGPSSKKKNKRKKPANPQSISHADENRHDDREDDVEHVVNGEDGNGEAEKDKPMVHISDILSFGYKTKAF